MYFVDIALRYVDDLNLEQIIGFFEVATESHIPRPDIRGGIASDQPELIILKKIKLKDDRMRTSDIKRKIRSLLAKNDIKLEFNIAGYGPSRWDKYGEKLAIVLGISGIVGMLFSMYPVLSPLFQ